MTMSAVVTTYAVRAAVLRGDRHLLLLRFVHPDRGVPRDAPALHRSLDVAADRARAHDLRRALRAEHRRPVSVARNAGLPTFYDKLLQVPFLNLSIKRIDRLARSRPLRALDPAALGRVAGAASAPSRLHVRLGDRVRRDERGAGRRRRPSRAVAAVLAAGLRGRTAVAVVSGRAAGFCDHGSGGPATSWAFSARRERDLAGAASRCDGLRARLRAGVRQRRSDAPDGHSRARRRRSTTTRSSCAAARDPIAERTPAALHALACRQGWSATSLLRS